MYDVDEVLPHYIRTALWSSCDCAEGRDVCEPLDANYCATDLAAQAHDAMRTDVADFLALIERERPGVYAEMAGTVWADPGKVGHDFWLTRNGHGAGFWDRYYGDQPAAELGEYLTRMSKPYREVDLYVGDDGKIYQQ